jgi:hypothetical protein
MLRKIMRFLGPSYLAYTLQELRPILRQGNQHFMCDLLKSLEEESKLKPGDLDSSMKILVEVSSRKSHP